MKTSYPDKEKYQRCLQDIGILLQKGSVIFRLMEREHVKQNSFTATQSFLLITLLENGELSVNRIARAMHLEKSSVTRIVMILIRDGFLQRTVFKEDKRLAIISLTPEGRQKAEQIKAKREQYYSNIISHLPAGHVREIMHSAEVLISALEKSME